MQIKRLRLSGFKSFVDPADLRIEPGLTGVVGPNGCGKSNLLEGLRWAMGENSAKSMRGAGMEDVIFAGTASRPARDFAEVAILTEQAGDETEVVRRIERGAGSAYRIDGKDVRAKDVALLFADAATGAHSPALVSQGRIGAVIAAKPADRRQMLEEAAGIAGLHVRRKDAEQKLRATEANLTRLDEIIADQSNRAAALRRQAKQAERYRTLSDRIRVAEARLIFARWREADGAATAAKAEAAACETRVAEATRAQEAAIAAQTAAATTLSEARTAALAARDRAGEAAHALAGLRAEQGAAERRIVELGEAQARIVADRAREGALASDAAAALARLEDETRALTAAIATGEAALPGLETARAEAEARARDAEVALAQALSRQAGEAAEARVAGAALAAARTRVERAERDAREHAAAAAALGEAAPLEEARAAASAGLAAGEAAATAARAALTTAEADARTAQEARDLADGVRATARADLAALEGEASALTRATQRSGRDRLLDHVRAAPGYERALAAALGDDLEIGLDAGAEAFWQGASPAPGDPAPPAGTVALVEHVDAPPALARRLAQVLVADADNGQPLAVGQRLVTRAGWLRRWDGLVAKAGGAAAAERLERLNRLAAIEAELPGVRARLAEAEAEVAAAEARIVSARAAGTAARGALTVAEQEGRAAQQALDRAVAALERLAGRRADMAERGSRILVEHEEAVREAAAAERAVAALPDLSAISGLVATLQREAEERRLAVAQARAERAGHDRELATARERLAAAGADGRSWRARAGDAARRIADMDARAVTLADEAETLAARPGELAAAVAAAERAHDAERAAAAEAAAAEHAAEAALRAVEVQGRATAETLAAAREARAGAVARAENGEARRVELGRLSGERFACPAPVLPERLGFAPAEVAAPAEESATHERLVLERERIGPVNLVAETELAELDQSAGASAVERDELIQAVNRLRHSIGTLNREGRQRLLAAFEAVDGHFRRLVHDPVRGRRGASRA